MNVRPLEWQHRGRRGDDWFANCPLGQYCAADIHGVPKAILRTIEDGQMEDVEIGSYRSVESAKRGAERHCRRVVLAMIEG